MHITNKTYIDNIPQGGSHMKHNTICIDILYMQQ